MPVTDGLSEILEAKCYGIVPVITPGAIANIGAYALGTFGRLESQ